MSDTGAGTEPAGTAVVEREGYRVAARLEGASEYAKTRRPVKYGRYSLIESPEAVLQFDINGEIVRARGKGADWPEPREWLKRTPGNDWVYYSTGGYSGTYESLGGGLLEEPIRFRMPAPYNEIFKATGEFYLPNFRYPSNSILGGEPFNNPAVTKILNCWPDIVRKALEALGPDGQAGDFLKAAVSNSPERLEQRAEEFHGIIGGRIGVLPPDARHVDYDVIPVPVSRGCLYNCSFCKVKDGKGFRALAKDEIRRTIGRLKNFYGLEQENYNSVLLAGNDALNAGRENVIFAAGCALGEFGIRESYMKGANLFMFGSVDSFLGAEAGLFRELNGIGCRTYINVGLESADQATLERLGKPVRAADVMRCFERMLRVNEEFENIEATANFVMDDSLPQSHYDTFMDLAGKSPAGEAGMAPVYLSPLCLTRPGERTMFHFNQLKSLSRMPVYLYIIQRL